MVPRLARWTWEQRADCVLLTRAEADATGLIRYVEQLRPLERLGDLLTRHRVPSESARRLGEPERSVTHEGEYGALAQFEGMLDGNATYCVLGFVFLDDSYSFLEGAAPVADGESLVLAVRTLLRGDTHQLGIRRRRFLYDPPSGWQGLSIGPMIAHYFPHGYPKVSSRISVHPAVPCLPSANAVIDVQRELGEDIVASKASVDARFTILEEVTDPVKLPSGLEGIRQQLVGRWNQESPCGRDIILVRDDRYAYAAELVTSLGNIKNAQPDFESLVQSIRPIPSVDGERSSETAVTHWAE